MHIVTLCVMLSMSVFDCISRIEGVCCHHIWILFSNCVKNMFKKRTFNFITILYGVVLYLHYVSSQSDSYTIGIQQNRSVKPLRNSKWSKNEINSDFCGGIFREKQVVIKSPRYPNIYPKNSNCKYIFYSPFVCINEFHIQFLDFELEPSISCTKDKVIIGDDEVLCGQVVGIMKYKAINGTLRIKFISDETMENKGFELVVTRLPCTNEEKWNETTSIPLKSGSHSEPKHSQKANPSSAPIISHAESLPDTSVVKPVCLSQSQSTRNLSPQNTFNPAVPAPHTPSSCCINIFNQQTFYLISPGFPNIYPSNCVFYIERHRPNICRLRIDFKYFLLDDWMQQKCTTNFLEIDGRRFCGCKTGFTYYTQWGASTKSILFNNMLRYEGIQGFILEITQEECPHKSFQQFQMPSRLLSMNHFMHANNPRRCAFNYISYANQKTLAKSVCVRNYG